MGKIHVKRKGNHWKLVCHNIRRLSFMPDERLASVTSFTIDKTEFKLSPSVGPSYLKLPDGTWEMVTDLLWISKERHAITYGPAMNVLENQFIIVIPQNTSIWNGVYLHMARQLALSWYIHARGNVQIITDDQVYDSHSARYNMIVLGGPEHNVWTQRRSKEGSASLVNFLERFGGYQIGKRVYQDEGTGNFLYSLLW
jgi:hypothetical protein